MADSTDVKARQGEVLALLLAADSPARKLEEFKGLFKQLEELEKQQQDATVREELFLSVLPTIEDAEQAVRDAENQVAQEKAKLADFAGELGKATFEALRSGHIADGPHFTDRKALQARIDELQQQKLTLSASESTGMLDKAKTQAQILKLTGQLKLEEFKIASANKALGSALLASRNLAPVRCETTEPLLKEIVTQNKTVNASIKKLEEQNSHSAKRIQDAAQQIGSSGPISGETLRSDIANARKQITTCRKAFATLCQGLLTRAAACETLKATLPQLEGLEITRDPLPFAGEQIKQLTGEFSEKAKKHLSIPTVRYAAIGASVVALILLLSAFRISGTTPENEPSAETTSDAQAPSLESDGESGKGSSRKRVATSSRSKPLTTNPVGRQHERGIEELFREMRNLEQAESASGRCIHFQIASKLDKDMYQIVVLSQPPWAAELRIPAVLLTNETEYTSDGRSLMVVRPKGSKELTLKNGFRKTFEVYEEIPGKTNREYQAQLQEYNQRLRVLGQELTCAFLRKYPDKPPESAWDLVQNELSEFASDGNLVEIRTAASDLLYWRLRDVTSKLTNVAWEEVLSPIEFAVREHDVVLFEKLVAWGNDPFWKPGARERLEKLAELSKSRRKDTYGLFDQNYNGIMECIRKYAKAAGK